MLENIKNGIKVIMTNSESNTLGNQSQLLNDAGNKYGASIIKKYSKKLINELGKKYSERTLRSMWQLYNEFKDEIWKPVVSKLNWTQLLILLSIKDRDKMNYYINVCIKNRLSKRQLQEKIKNNEYERLDNNKN